MGGGGRVVGGGGRVVGDGGRVVGDGVCVSAVKEDDNIHDVLEL